MSIKTIGVLTSGGDAPGMNAAIRAVVRTAIGLGMKVYGIRRGYNGLIEGDVIEMDLRSVSDIIHRGGTVLYTARSPLFKTEQGVQMAVDNCRKFGIEGIVVIGGDGSFRGAADLSSRGIPCIGVPGTIDNDISSTQYTIGFDTAMNTAMEMIDKLRDTSQSHDRCSVVEVMGRGAGHLALQTGIAVGATYIILKEAPYSVEKICDKIKATQQLGKHHFIIIVSEDVTDVVALAKEIEERTGVESRATVLGHVQRGGSPTVRDRRMASLMGSYAVNLLKNNKGNRVVSFQNAVVVDYDIQEALSMKKTIDINEYHTANSISI